MPAFRLSCLLLLVLTRRAWGPRSARTHAKTIRNGPRPAPADPAKTPVPSRAVRLAALTFAAVETGIEDGASLWGYLFLTAGRGLGHPAAGLAMCGLGAAEPPGRAERPIGDCACAPGGARAADPRPGLRRRGARAAGRALGWPGLAPGRPAVSPRDIWAVLGTPQTGAWTGPGALVRWNGRRWSVVTLPAPASRVHYHLTQLAADGAGGIRAIGPCANCQRIPSRLWHERAGQWSGPLVPSLARRRWILFGLAAAGRSMWAAGDVDGSGPSGLIALWAPTHSFG